MARYIDADSLLEQISKKKCEVGKVRYLDGFNDGLMRVRSMISTAPTADVVPKSEVVRVIGQIKAHIERAVPLVGAQTEYKLGLWFAELKKKYTEVEK